MFLYQFRHKFKLLFILSAMVIAVISLWATQVLVKKLANEEKNKVELWAESVKLLSLQPATSADNAEVLNAYDNLLFQIVQSNTTIPLIVADQDEQVVMSLNMEVPSTKSETFFAKKVASFKAKNQPIRLDIDDSTYQYVYYDESEMLKKLNLFPYVQLLVVFIFVLIAFWALSSTKKAEQNKVWVGLSKETAHQLGTPISSLMAWTEFLRTQAISSTIVDELDKDVLHLNRVADRFSKIGSTPDFLPIEVNESLAKAVEYIQTRISSKVVVHTHCTLQPVYAFLNDSLFSWVIENLVKNGVDAMDGVGSLTITVSHSANWVKIDVQDTGKGIPKSKFKTVFTPGHTTKARGWGLGLSLVRRIVESYGKGKIYVLSSELNKGTTFRIELKKHQTT